MRTRVIWLFLEAIFKIIFKKTVFLEKKNISLSLSKKHVKKKKKNTNKQYQTAALNISPFTAREKLHSNSKRFHPLHGKCMKHCEDSIILHVIN